MSKLNDNDTDLFELRNFFYIGAYKEVITDAANIKKTSMEKDFYMYRAYIAEQNYRVVMDDISVNEKSGLRALRYLAEYLSKSTEHDNIINNLDHKMIDVKSMDKWWLIGIALTYYAAGIYTMVLKVAAQINTIEGHALMIQTLLKINRVDLAKKLLLKMQEMDDDDILTQLANAWINIYLGGEKIDDAYYIYNELIEKWKPTLLLLNGQITCHLLQNKYDEADTLLRLCTDKDSNNIDTIINLLFIAQHSNKNTIDNINRYISQLHEFHMYTEIFNELKVKENDFDYLCNNYQHSNDMYIEELIL